MRDSDKKQLVNIITKPQHRYERVWLSSLVLILSLLGLFVAWWFWHAIVQGTERPQLDIVGYAAPIGLAISCLVGLIASLLITKRQPVAVTTLWQAIVVGIVSFVGIAVNSVMTFVRYNDVNWWQSIGQAFREFSVVEVGSLNVSIPMIITIVIIVSIIVSDMIKGKK